MDASNSSFKDGMNSCFNGTLQNTYSRTNNSNVPEIRTVLPTLKNLRLMMNNSRKPQIISKDQSFTKRLEIFRARLSLRKNKLKEQQHLGFESYFLNIEGVFTLNWQLPLGAKTLYLTEGIYIYLYIYICVYKKCIFQLR